MPFEKRAINISTSSTRLNRFDLTQGNIFSKLLLVAAPIMGTSLMQMMYNLTDMFWLGRLSADAVAASGSAGMFLWLSMAFMMAGRMGAEIGVSQNMGRRDVESAKHFSQNALIISVVLGVAYGLLLIFFSPGLIQIFDIQEAGIAADGAAYMSIVGIGIPFTFISGALTGTFNAAGNSRVSFISNTIGLMVNIILDPIMIFNMGMGIHGAAYATIIAQGVVCVCFLFNIKFHKNRPFERYVFFVKPDWGKIKQIFKWSAPISVESMLFTLLSMLITRQMAAFGADALAVSRVGSQVESLSWMIGGGFSSALTAFIGQNFGAGMWTRIRRGFRVSVAAMTVWGLCVTAILLFAGRYLFLVFLPEPGIVDLGAEYLMILSSCQLFQCMEGVAAGMFRGTGKTLPPSIVSITGNALRVPLAWVLSQTPLGIYGIFWALAIGATMRGLCITVWYVIHARKQPREDLPRVSEGGAEASAMGAADVNAV